MNFLAMAAPNPALAPVTNTVIDMPQYECESCSGNGLRRGGGLGLLHVGRQSVAERPIFPLVRREVYLHVLLPQPGISREQFRYPLIEPLLGGGVPPVTGYDIDEDNIRGTMDA